MASDDVAKGSLARLLEAMHEMGYPPAARIVCCDPGDGGVLVRVTLTNGESILAELDDLPAVIEEIGSPIPMAGGRVMRPDYEFAAPVQPPAAALPGLTASGVGYVGTHKEGEVR